MLTSVGDGNDRGTTVQAPYQNILWGVRKNSRDPRRRLKNGPLNVQYRRIRVACNSGVEIVPIALSRATNVAFEHCIIVIKCMQSRSVICQLLSSRDDV